MTEPGPSPDPAPTPDLDPVPVPVPVPRPQTSTVAVVSLIAGIFSAVGGCLLCGLPPIVAIVTGHLGIAHTRRGESSGFGMALAGLILGYVLVLPTLLLLFTGLFSAVDYAGLPHFVDDFFDSF
ncbi:DUF4190 domain-containing protein [Micromonospora sonneratiae]|uniref:DUF4190 domain-containing protein n=1 Tax=Micromonospora sonneratiae TaxID=1184706 RepID=A0ABW3YM54_9ACTN